jgi:hypothetical protein
MSEFYTFPHIERLERRPEVFVLGQVVALEKVDGTNARFGLVDGVFKVGSRNQELKEGEPDSFGFGAWVLEQGIEQKLRGVSEVGEDIIVYGEWYGKGIQKRLAYADGRHFCGFAVRKGRAFLPVLDALDFIGGTLGLETAPILYQGEPTASVLDALRVCLSETALIHGQADQSHEGVVIWPVYPFMDAHGDWVIAKHKRPEFEETRSARTGQTPAALAANAKAFADEYGTSERFQHVLSTLRADGLDVGSPKSIGTILRAFVEDASREGAADYELLDKPTRNQANKLLSTFAKQQLG